MPDCIGNSTSFRGARPGLTAVGFATLLLVALVLGLRSDAAEMRVHRDLAYIENGDRLQKLDVYAPNEGDNLPVVIWIHGGGWKGGDKGNMQAKPQACVDQGYIFVSANYRMLPQVQIDEMARDVARAIRWVHDHARDYGGSADRLVVAGHSAGAHLAALVCTDSSYLEGVGLSLTSIRGCVPVDTAAYDVPDQIRNVRAPRLVNYESVFGNTEERQRTLSPVVHVASGKGIPQFLILHVADRADSTAQSKNFSAALERAGVSARLYAARGTDHAGINRNLGRPDDGGTKELFAFLAQVTKAGDEDR